MPRENLFGTGSEPIAMFEFIGDGSCEVLHDGPRSISTELVAPRVVKLLRSADQGHISVADQPKEIIVWIDVLFSDRYNQSQVGVGRNVSRYTICAIAQLRYSSLRYNKAL